MKPLVEDCCKLYLGSPDVHPENTEATCPTCERYWITQPCAEAGSEWVFENVRWGGIAAIGTAFKEKDDDTTVSTELGRIGNGAGESRPGDAGAGPPPRASK